VRPEATVSKGKTYPSEIEEPIQPEREGEWYRYRARHCVTIWRAA